MTKIPGLLEGTPALRFTGTRRTHDKDAMADGKELFQLHHLQSERFVGIVAQTFAGLRYVGFQGHILFPRRIDSGEQIIQQSKEDHFVLLHNLGRIEISKCPHEEGIFRHFWFSSLKCSGNNQDRLDGPKAPIVVELWGKQRLEEGI